MNQEMEPLHVVLLIWVMSIMALMTVALLSYLTLGYM